jgi:hypothetical protein
MFVVRRAARRRDSGDGSGDSASFVEDNGRGVSSFGESKKACMQRPSMVGSAR